MSGVYGLGLNNGDLALLLPECGQRDERRPELAASEAAGFDEKDASFDFGTLSTRRGYRAEAGWGGGSGFCG